MYDIISVGDATLDVFLNLNEANVRCELKTEKCEICFNYADKIPVESVARVPGAGNASNNTVGSARLGMKAAIVSILGDDEIGHSIFRRWKNEGVSTKCVVFDKKRGTNYSTVLNYRGERTILVFHEKRTYKFPDGLKPSKWIYYTSLGKGSEVLHRPLVSYAKRNGVKLVFQPGTFQLKLGLEKMRSLIAASEAIIVNKEEAERIVGDSTKDIKVLLSRLHEVGCRIAVITDGPKGSSTYDGNKFLNIGIFDVPVIERTGCGDAYATGFVAALHNGESAYEAMRWGTGNAASVLGFIGPQAGLLKTDGMRRMLARFKNVKASEM